MLTESRALDRIQTIVMKIHFLQRDLDEALFEQSERTRKALAEAKMLMKIADREMRRMK